MNHLTSILVMLMPWLLFLMFIGLCFMLINWARKRKATALALGIFVQIFLPDPKAQITIEAIAERKQEVKKQHDEEGKLKDGEDENPPV